MEFKDLLNPQFYIDNGGLWLVLFIVFAETGLFAGFFLPGDSLLFVSGIFSDKLIKSIGIDLGSNFLHVFMLSSMVAIAGIIGIGLVLYSGNAKGVKEPCGKGSTNELCQAWKNPTVKRGQIP